MLHVRRTLLMLLMISLIPYVCFAKSKEQLPIVKNYNKSIIVNNGTVDFNDLTVYVKRDDNFRNLNLYKTYIYGTIVNNTGQNWDNLTFYIRYTDSAGNFIYQQEFNTYQLKESSSKSLTYGKTQYDSIDTTDQIMNADMKRASNIEILFDKGKLSATPHIILTKPYVNDKLHYTDSFIDVSFTTPYVKGIDLTIKNKTNLPIKIDWNQVSFVSMDGEMSKVIHEGIKLNNAGEMQPPTIIPPNATLSDIILPTSHYYWSDRWKYIPILPRGESAFSSIGKQFSIYLPLDINDKVNHYNFVFKIDRVTND